ncbi:MAG: nitroreductase [Acidithiobacillales bacterium SG8_45]|nr:MAG: nitroreductase [Acidithiobacillales bacterium SG8_45]
MRKPAKTFEPIHDLIADRWSGRAFKPEPVSREQIIAMVEAAHWAPSCFNDQPWRFLVWDKNHDADTWQQAFDCLDEGNRQWVIDAPVLLLVCSDTEFSKRPGRANRWGQHDAGMASQNLHLQAVALGLMTHPMAGYDKPRAREVFEIPERYDELAMIAVGHPVDSADDLDEKRRERELEPREREPLGSRFFDGHWDKPIR